MRNYLEVMEELHKAGKTFAFVVVDAQNDFITGALKNDAAQAALPALAKALEEARKLNANVFFTMDTHYNCASFISPSYMNSQEGQKLPIPHCIYGTWGREIASTIPVKHKDTVIEKETFGYQDWDAENLDNFDAVFIVGYCTDICVVSNALIIKAMYPELPVYVIAECCAGVTPETHEAALTTMKSCQVNVI